MRASQAAQQGRGEAAAAAGSVEVRGELELVGRS
jgi:hypothetical protein